MHHFLEGLSSTDACAISQYVLANGKSHKSDDDLGHLLLKFSGLWMCIYAFG
jgi:hypothetical protein